MIRMISQANKTLQEGEKKNLETWLWKSYSNSTKMLILLGMYHYFRFETGVNNACYSRVYQFPEAKTSTLAE